MPHFALLVGAEITCFGIVLVIVIPLIRCLVHFFAKAGELGALLKALSNVMVRSTSLLVELGVLRV